MKINAFKNYMFYFASPYLERSTCPFLFNRTQSILINNPINKAKKNHGKLVMFRSVYERGEFPARGAGWEDRIYTTGPDTPNLGACV